MIGVKLAAALCDLPDGKMPDDVILDILVLIEEKKYLDASYLMRAHTGMSLQDSARTMKLLAKEELGKDILTGIK